MYYDCRLIAKIKRDSKPPPCWHSPIKQCAYWSWDRPSLVGTRRRSLPHRQLRIVAVHHYHFVPTHVICFFLPHVQLTLLRFIFLGICCETSVLKYSWNAIHDTKFIHFLLCFWIVLGFLRAQRSVQGDSTLSHVKIEKQLPLMKCEPCL